MADHVNERTIAALEKLIHEMQFLVEHPRMQQKRWVAAGKVWLPILYQAKEDLARPVNTPSSTVQPIELPSAKSEPAMLVKVNYGKGETYVNVKLDEVAQVNVARHGEAGYYVQRGATNGFVLKNGVHYLTNVDEAKRLVEAIKQYNNE